MTSSPIPLAQELLQRALSPDTAVSIYNERAVKRTLYLHPTPREPSARATRRKALNLKKEAAHKRKKLTPRPLSARQKRALGLTDIPDAQKKWEIYEPLHKLWTGYMCEILGINTSKGDTSATGVEPFYISPASAGPILASADMHGAMVEVVRSRCVSRVGVKGIVVRDCRFVFEVVTRGGGVKIVPKEHSVFRVEVDVGGEGGKEEGDSKRKLVFDVMGEQFQSRAPDRANKKFKMHYQWDL
jgi:ribonuclease P protein subunit POP4